MWNSADDGESCTGFFSIDIYSSTDIAWEGYIPEPFAAESPLVQSSFIYRNLMWDSADHGESCTGFVSIDIYSSTDIAWEGVWLRMTASRARDLSQVMFT